MTPYPVEQHPLEPFLPSNAKILMLGSFPPPLNRWSMNFFYPNFINDMWRVIGIIFFDDPMHFVNGKRFDEDLIRRFCSGKGIALFDTAQSVRRLNQNASDKFLEIVEKANLFQILEKIPECTAIASTGQKATETLLSILTENSFSEPLQLPAIGSFVTFTFEQRQIKLYRMPSTSRAYPKSLKEKADIYKPLFLPIL